METMMMSDPALFGESVTLPIKAKRGAAIENMYRTIPVEEVSVNDWIGHFHRVKAVELVEGRVIATFGRDIVGTRDIGAIGTDRVVVQRMIDVNTQGLK